MEEDIRKCPQTTDPVIEICYQKALERKTYDQGEATFPMVIDSKGQVTKVSLVSSKLKDKTLEQCIIEEIKNSPSPHLKAPIKQLSCFV